MSRAEPQRHDWPRTLIVIPCLNEEEHIGPLLDQLLREAEEIDCTIHVADGGSTDRTRTIVEEYRSRSARISLVENPQRIQSAAVNRVVERFGTGCTYLIRIDAHGDYPDDYCRILLEEAEKTGAGSVVVSMRTVGRRPFQSAVAKAQNSFLGTGGSRHRIGGEGRFVDHGHHALMRVDAFRAVGGYDESFSHNEDAELDRRLADHGTRIWMTGRTHMVYYPRSSAASLFRQYLGYGRGRARNIRKHRTIPKPRQAAPLLVAPAVLIGLLALLAAPAPVGLVLALPALLWAAICLCYGLALAAREKKLSLASAGIAAMVMHLAWSGGFWLGLFAASPRETVKEAPV